MAIKNLLLGGTDLVNGDDVNAANWNDTFDAAVTQLRHPFGGDGTDGSLTVAGAVNLNLDQVYQYIDVTVNAGQTLSTGGSNGVMLILIQGDSSPMNLVRIYPPLRLGLK